MLRRDQVLLQGKSCLLCQVRQPEVLRGWQVPSSCEKVLLCRSRLLCGQARLLLLLRSDAENLRRGWVHGSHREMLPSQGRRGRRRAWLREKRRLGSMDEV